LSPHILDEGDRVSNFEVVRRVASSRAATLYEATQMGRRVFLKISHPGLANARRLEREAEFLRELAASRQQDALELPRLLPPYPTTTLDEDASGKVMLGRELLHFIVLEPFDGQPLSDVLLRQPLVVDSQRGMADCPIGEPD
jgi:hypothetical protein